MEAKYDLVVIGGGNAGYTPAIRASQHGMRVALIEKSKLGGNCLHRGCIPTKAMLRATSMLADLRGRGEELGVLANGVSFDYARAASHRDRVVEQLHRGTRGLMRKNSITVYEGVGSFVGPEKVEVEGADGKKETLEDLADVPGVRRSTTGAKKGGLKSVHEAQRQERATHPRSKNR